MVGYITSTDSSITVTNSAGNIDLSVASGGGLTWSNISASQTLAVANGYFCSSGGALSLALPATSAVGKIIEVVLIGSTSFTITQSAGQQIIIGNRQSTAGARGSIASTQQGDAIKLVCQTANLTWVATSSMGNLTVV